jgi:cell division protein FtsZ
VIDDAMGDEVRVTVIAAGFERFDEGKGKRSDGSLGLSSGEDVFAAVGKELDLGDDEFDVPSFLK